MICLITGTARGIGRAIAEKFLQEGHRVYGIDLRPEGPDHPLYTHLRQDVREALPDLPDPERGNLSGKRTESVVTR